MKLITPFFLLIGTVIFAQQNLKINGNIVNNQSKNADIEVYLYDTQDQLVKTTFTQNGTFEFSQLKPQKYYLKIVSEDNSQKEPAFTLESDKSITVVIDQKATEIEEVQLNKKKRIFQIDKGNMNIDVANSPLNKVPSSSDLMAKLPFVMMDANGEGLSVVGKGIPILYIDNQKVDFNTLSVLSVDDIKSVEIIRNPSAKYEAEGKAVIRVILKNNKKEGAKLTLSETMSFQKRFNNYFSANFQKKKNKTEWKLNAAYNAIQHWESNGYDYSVQEKNIKSNYIIESITKRPQILVGASVYQELNHDGDYLTLAVNGNFRPDIGDNNTITDYEENGNKNHVLTLNHQERKRATLNTIFNYSKKLKSLDANIFAGFQYNRESDNIDYTFFNKINDDPDYLFSQFRSQLYSVNAYSGRVDIEKSFKDDYKVEFGGSFTEAEAFTDNITDYKTIQPVEYFKYYFHEENIASYITFSGEKQRLSFKGGLRMETTDAKGFDQFIQATTLTRSYVDWFPNAEISFKQNKDFMYTLNYNRSIDRPNYGNLASGGLYGSPYVEYGGNPNLLPTYTSTISASISLHKWAINASYYNSKNPVGYTLTYDENRNISRFTALNFDKEIGMSLGLDVPFEWKIWTSQNSVSLNYNKTQDQLSSVKKSTPFLYFYTNNTFNLGKGFNFLLDGSVITKRTEGLYENNAVCLLNLGLTKSVANFDFTVRYNDVFKQLTYIQSLSYGKISSKGSFFGDTPVFSIAVKYNFGKISKSDYKESEVNKTSDRIK